MPSGIIGDDVQMVAEGVEQVSENNVVVIPADGNMSGDFQHPKLAHGIEFIDPSVEPEPDREYHRREESGYQPRPQLQ